MQVVVMRGIKFVSVCLLFVILWSSGWIGSKFGSLTLVSDSMSLTSSSNNLNDLIDLVIYQQERIKTLLHEAEQREIFRNCL